MRCLGNRYLRQTFLTLAVVLIVSAAAFTSSDVKDIDFLYAFGAYAGPRGKGKILSVRGDVLLQAGDRLKLYFEPKIDQYFYLLHVSSQGELAALHPRAGQAARIGRGTQIFIPDGNVWFELDNHPGQEKFYFIASADRLGRLEELCARHATLQDKAEVQTSSQDILDEIKRLKQKHQQLSAPAEKPVRIGGTVRGQQPSDLPDGTDIIPLAAEVKAPGFYSRIFTVDHR